MKNFGFKKIIYQILFRSRIILLAITLLYAPFAFSETTDILNLAIANYQKEVIGEKSGVIKISSDSEACAHPKTVAFSDDLIFFVWDGIYKNKRKIFFREYHKNIFKEPIILDTDLDSEGFEPDIAVDEKSNPHIIWVSQKENKQSLNYAVRIDGKWKFETSIFETIEQNIESPIIGVKNEGKSVYIAFQSGKGVNYHIFSGIKNEQDKFIIYRLSLETSDHYNLYPQLFMYPSPSVFWYESIGSEFVLVGVRYDENKKLWKVLDLDKVSGLSTNRLPLIMMNSASEIGGVWYDTFNKFDKIYFGLENYQKGKGVPVNINSSFNEGQPFGIFKEDKLIYISFINSDENQVYFSIGKIENSGVKFLESAIRISNPKPGFYCSPRVTASENKIIIIWSSNLRDGGDGGIYIKIINISNV